MRLYKIVLVVFVVLLVIPLLTHYYLTQVGSESDGKVRDATEEVSPWITHQLTDIDRLQGQDLKFRIEELLRIKQSVSVELRDLEGRRTNVQTEISTLSRKLEEFKTETGRKRNELDRLQISLAQAQVAEKEAMERNTPRLGRPRALHSLRSIPIVRDLDQVRTQVQCSMDSCFDFSLCPLSSQFNFYLYPLNSTSPDLRILHQVLSFNAYKTKENRALRSCIFLLLLDNCSQTALQALDTLPNWFGDGRNHIIWLNCKSEDADQELTQANRKFFGRALVVDQAAVRSGFREKFDLVLSHWAKAVPTGEIWSHLPPVVPAKRKYLTTYLGGETEPWIQSELLKIQQEDPASFVFQFSCTTLRSRKQEEMQNEVISAELERSAKNMESYTNKKLSSLCSNDLLRTRLLLDSSFSLILLPPGETDLLSTQDLQLRLYESLKFGAIPVILGTRFSLPYEEVIDWSRVVVSLPVARVTEIHYFLKSLTDSDVLGLRKNGRLVFEKYLGSVENVVETVLGVFRTRIGLPPLPYKEVHWKSLFNESFTPLKLESFTIDPEDEENLGPMEPSYPSPAFTRNYTTTSIQKYDLWNTHFTPFRLYPFTPWELILPSEAKFQGSSIGFRPIGSGGGGSGKEFSEALGGNSAKEQFTVVMLTYERESVLMTSLQRLFSLPYLNKVLVVWNSPQPPSPDLKWPDIGVPIRVVKAEKNSLNNRFLPFEDIETEAVLSIDDDAHLRHDEIVFGFRVWRENRDRVVGFPGRFHALDLTHGGWLYNSNYSCELSMVLTGAAFYHKLYSYMYTYEMPEAIRNKVDELMNCEDIAMNFLVSHVTQKPPVKVTSRWTFRCPGCPVTLSEDDSHFQERHHCINFFTKVYGYTPLLNTQFRADSVLFKTRIPHDKQKCFKYI